MPDFTGQTLTERILRKPRATADPRRERRPVGVSTLVDAMNHPQRECAMTEFDVALTPR
jgi:hypothetical protein